MQSAWGEALEAGRAATSLLAVGSTPWFGEVARVLVCGLFVSDLDVTAAMLPLFLQATPPEAAVGPYAAAVFNTCAALGLMGEVTLAWSLVERAEALEKACVDHDPVFVRLVRLSRVLLYLFTEQPGLALSGLSELSKIADTTLNAFSRAAIHTFSVMAFAIVGQRTKADEAARALRTESELTFWIEWTSYLCSLAKIDIGRSSDAIPVLRAGVHHPDSYLGSYFRAALAFALVDLDELDAAHNEASIALEHSAASPVARLCCFAALARIELLRGRAAEALVLAEQGLEQLTSSWPALVSTLQVVRAEALRALGRADDARAAIREGRERILRISATIADPELRDSFVTNVHFNARVLSLAHEWLDETGGHAFI
jgi:hypothetical protein